MMKTNMQGAHIVILCTKTNFFINERLESYMPIAEKWNFDSILGQGRFSTVYKIISKDNLTENA